MVRTSIERSAAEREGIAWIEVEKGCGGDEDGKHVHGERVVIMTAMVKMIRMTMGSHCMYFAAMPVR